MCHFVVHVFRTSTIKDVTVVDIVYSLALGDAIESVVDDSLMQGLYVLTGQKDIGTTQGDDGHDEVLFHTIDR